LDATGILFTLGVTLLTGLIFGVVPSAEAARRNVNEALNQGGRSGSSGISKRLRGALVAGEVALAVVLLVGAGLLIRTVRAMFAADLGFHRDGLLTLRLNVSPQSYPREEQLAVFGRDLMEKTLAVPGVISASIAGGLPTQNLSFASCNIEGIPNQSGKAESMTSVRAVGETYFQTMIIPLLRGRSFTHEEVENPRSNVIVVNQAFANQVFHAADPLGKSIHISDTSRVIVGVVADAAQLGPETPVDPEVYVPSDRYRQLTLVVRAARNVAPALSSIVRSIDRTQPAPKFQTMNESLGEFIEDKKFVMELLGCFAALALLLAAAGIYGVVAYSVNQRTREIGIRMALGAKALDILTLIVREGLSVAWIGVAVGIAGATALSRLLRGLLFDVSTLDPVTFASGAAALIFVAVLASTVPARRAANLAPLDALRDE
jgi:putative ABC transport system permease protein